MKTFSAKPLEVKRDWFVVDASEKVLGRLAAEIALRLRGKHKPEYTPHVDTGDFIVVVNADKLVLSAEKAGKKTYYRHTGYPGGIYETTFQEMQAKHPGRALEIAVKGMLPKLFLHLSECHSALVRLFTPQKHLLYPIFHAILLLKEILGITAGFIESVEADSTHARDCPVS